MMRRIMENSKRFFMVNRLEKSPQTNILFMKEKEQLAKSLFVNLIITAKTSYIIMPYSKYLE